VGSETRKLHRSKYGPLSVEGLKPGRWRDLSPAEISSLKKSS
jgi:16S rRNA U516 pseudouridylate synthase RsuA-like enzyme